MPDRDTYRSDPKRRSRDPRDDGAARGGGSDYGWSSASEGRSFVDQDAGAPYGARYGRGGGRYGGQGAYGQGPGPGGYGYGSGVTGWDQDRSGERFGQLDPDYDQGGQGGYAAEQRGGEFRSAGRYARPEGRFDDRGSGYRGWTRDAHERQPARGEAPAERSEQASHRTAVAHAADEHERSYRRWRDAQLDAHDQDYARWRDQQARRYDDDYGQWRSQRHEAFSKDFEGWRSSRGAQMTQSSTPLTANTPEVENVTDGRQPAEDRDN